MEGLKLLDRAKAAGLDVRAEEDNLVVRGPKRAEPIARVLLARKVDVLPYLPPALLAWASELAEQDLMLPGPVSYVEKHNCPVSTRRVSWCATRYLRTIVEARHYQQHPNLGWGQWTPTWWREREMEAVSALAALKKAVQDDEQAE